MKKIIFTSMLLIFLSACSASAPVVEKNTTDISVSMPNPAAIYCSEIMGYEYETTQTANGETAHCVLPNAERCEQWAFYAGECGEEYSYCAHVGYETQARSDGQDPFSPQYTVCANAGEARSLSVMSPLAEIISNRASADANANATSLQDFSVTANALPAQLDWRDRSGANWLTPVKNQSFCGSCWAFAANAITESHQKIIRDDATIDIDLSEQELIGCTAAGNCLSGSSELALQHIRDTGIVTETCSPYTLDHTCSVCPDPIRTQISNQHAIWSPPNDTIKAALIEHGPVIAYMGVNTEYGGHFDENNIYRCDDDSGINHAVVIVGYDDATGAWIVRNSWGATWGPTSDGYFNVGYGECGINTYLGFIASNNDDFDYALPITSIPSQETMNTQIATIDPDDPTLDGCSINGSGSATVWYRYDPPIDTAISLDTNGTDYSTFIAVWRGSRDSLSLLSCGSEETALQVSAGETYYIEVGEKQ